IVGSVDDRRRPLLRIELPGRPDGLLALLDTGFNGEILVAEADIEALGFRARAGFSAVELAAGQRIQLQRGQGTIVWLSAARRVEVLITKELPGPRRDGDPIMLVGTGLLSPNLLLIDFAMATVEIETQDQP
ncbi:unnamed protein product, partial [Phaeothamnion confervicola]